MTRTKWNKTKPWEDANQRELHKGGISVGLAFTVLLKRLNLRLKGKHLDLLLDWLNKNVKVGSL